MCSNMQTFVIFWIYLARNQLEELPRYNSSFVNCRVKRSPIPLEMSKYVHTIYSNVRNFVRLFPQIKIRFADNMKYHYH